jgi:N-acetylneuraminate lyase
MKTRLTGLIAAPFTPMLPNGGINLGMIEPLAQALAANNVAGAFINGTTGEGASLSTEERLQIAQEWVRVAPPSLRIIVHAGHQSIVDSRALAAHAQQIEAHAFATIAPSFFRINNIEQLVDWCAQIAGAAPSLPFYYYHFPVMTGADLPMIDFLKAAGRRIPNLAGIKFTHENLMDYRRCLDFENGRFDVLFGRDEMMLAALGMGATGLVGSTYNYLAPLYHRLIDAFRTGDFDTAQRLQSDAIEVIAVMSRRGGLAAGKAMMRLIGLDCGPVRAPLQNLITEGLAALQRDLKSVGFPLAAPKPARRSRSAALRGSVK